MASRGKLDQEQIGNTKDPATGLPVYSLYAGANRRPDPAMLRDVDTLVFDIQDVGTRFYTYACTMASAMEEAGKLGLRFVVLDRPNPITGEHVEGPVLDPALTSFVGCMAIPVRHGMTIGELAGFYNSTLNPQADLLVVPMRHWERSAWWDETGLPWVDPSPNMRSLNAALLYPGIGMLEYSRNYSVGRGTDAPFEQIGADWIKGTELAASLNALDLPGIRVYPVRFRPASSNLAGQTIEGVRFTITDRDAFDSVRFGLALAGILHGLYPGRLDSRANEKLIGSPTVVAAIEAGESPATVLAGQGQRARILPCPPVAIPSVLSRAILPRSSLRASSLFVFWLVLAAGRAAAPFHGGFGGRGHPERRPAPALAAAPSEALEDDDRLFDLLAFCAQFRKHFRQIHAHVLPRFVVNTLRTCSPEL